MKQVIGSSDKRVLQNEGWFDRVLRITIGGTMILGTAYLLEYDFTPRLTWEYYVMLLGIAPVITGFVGWCPIYKLLGIRTCGGGGRNPCGSLPFEIDAALGHHPIPDSDVERSLERSHHGKKKAA